MFEVLEGRLIWEKTPQGIHVEIPARRGSLSSLYLPLFVIWMAFTIAYARYSAGKDPSEELQSTQLSIVIVGIAVAFFFLLIWSALNFTRQTLLTVEPELLKIQQRVMGIDVVTRSYPNDQVSNLRFIAPNRTVGSAGVVDSASSRIHFLAGAQSCLFAAGVTKPEADALIDRMMDVYSFPIYEGAKPAMRGIE